MKRMSTNCTFDCLFFRHLRASSVGGMLQLPPPPEPDYSNLPPPPSYFYDDDNDDDGPDSSPRPAGSKHLTIAYLNGGHEEPEDEVSDEASYGPGGEGLPQPDTYHTLRSNGSMKSVKIAPEVTEFHYATPGKKHVYMYLQLLVWDFREQWPYTLSE